MYILAFTFPFERYANDIFMGYKVDVICRAMREIHEFWANIIQIAIATWLLSQHIGYAAAGPIIISVFSLAATMLVSPLAKKYRVGWLEKTQKRVGKLYKQCLIPCYLTSSFCNYYSCTEFSDALQELLLQ